MSEAGGEGDPGGVMKGDERIRIVVAAFGRAGGFEAESFRPGISLQRDSVARCRTIRPTLTWNSHPRKFCSRAHDFVSGIDAGSEIVSRRHSAAVRSSEGCFQIDSFEAPLITTCDRASPDHPL